MPWPGPQPMRSTHMFRVPGPIETQSSPVFIMLLLIVISEEYCTWMPSVFGLLLGALMLVYSILMFLLRPMAIWIVWLLIDVNPLTYMSLHHMNEIDCISNHCKIFKGWWSTTNDFYNKLYHGTRSHAIKEPWYE